MVRFVGVASTKETATAIARTWMHSTGSPRTACRDCRFRRRQFLAKCWSRHSSVNQSSFFGTLCQLGVCEQISEELSSRLFFSTHHNRPRDTFFLLPQDPRMPYCVKLFFRVRRPDFSCGLGLETRHRRYIQVGNGVEVVETFTYL